MKRTGPPCGHSACSQHFIETGSTECVVEVPGVAPCPSTSPSGARCLLKLGHPGQHYNPASVPA